MALYIGNNKVTIYDGNNNPSNAIVPLLPSEYEQKTYIEGNGNAYLNTGIVGHTNDVVQIKFCTTKKDSTDWHYIIGYENGEGNRFGIYHQNANIFNVDFWKGAGNANRKTNICSAALNTIYEFNVANCYVDDIANSTKILKASTLGTYSSSITYKILDNRSSKKGHRTTRIYYCRIYKAGIKVRDYIPAMRKSDNVYGLYDLVSNAFYTSSSTTAFSGA